MNKKKVSLKDRFQQLAGVIACLAGICIIISPLERMFWQIEIIASCLGWMVIVAAIMFMVGKEWVRNIAILSSIAALFASIGSVGNAMFAIQAISIALGLAGLANSKWMQISALSLPLILFSVSHEKNEGSSPGTIAVLTQSMIGGEGDAKRILQKIQAFNPDIVVLTQVDKTWREILKTMPYTTKLMDSDGLRGGLVLLTRLNVQSVEKINIPNSLQQNAIIVTVYIENSPLQIICMYPPPPTSDNTGEERDAYLKKIQEKMEENEIPTILAGNFQLSPFNSKWQILDPSHQLQSHTTWWHGTHRTFYGLLGIAIDHIVTTPDVIKRKTTLIDIENLKHKGLMAKLYLPIK